VPQIESPDPIPITLPAIPCEPTDEVFTPVQIHTRCSGPICLSTAVHAANCLLASTPVSLGAADSVLKGSGCTAELEIARFGEAGAAGILLSRRRRAGDGIVAAATPRKRSIFMQA
jgi:hypothetical protein